MEWFGYISAVGFFIAYIPQLVRTYRLKSVDDISLWMWVLTLGAYMSGLIYGLGLGEEPLILNYMIGVCCTLMMLLMYFLYRDPRKDEVRNIVAREIKALRRKFNEEN